MKLIELTRKYNVEIDNKLKVTVVDDEDYEWLNQFNWCVGGWKKDQVLRRIVKDGKTTTVTMAREIMKPGKGMIVKHRNENNFDNQKENLFLKPKKNDCS